MTTLIKIMDNIKCNIFLLKITVTQATTSVSLSNSKVQAWENHLYSNSEYSILLNSCFAKNKPVNRNTLNSCAHNLGLAWFCCENALRGVSETVETCFAKGLQHLSCQSERFFDTCKNGRASFIRTAGYLSKKSIHRQLAEDLLVFQMCYGEQRPPWNTEGRSPTDQNSYIWPGSFRGENAGRARPTPIGCICRLQLGSEWRDEEKQKSINSTPKHLTEYFLWHLACDEH